jgi:CelD/BcsL family acetyltransferase involved in cellulose biosynthesis
VEFGLSEGSLVATAGDLRIAALETDLHDGAIDSMLPEWERLFAADLDATPFASAEWARAWWPHWAGDARPWIVTVRSGGRLVGLAPLVLRTRGPFRVLAPLGRHPSNYWDVVALPELRAQVAAAVAEEIARRAREWDAVMLSGLPQGAPIDDALAAQRLAARRRAPVPYPGIELPSSFDEYLAALPRKRRKDLRRHLRRVDEGELECRDVRDPDELRGTIDRWQELRVQWWREREKGMNPEHGSERFRAFIHDLVQLLVPARLAAVWEFRRDDEVVGVEINLTDERRFYAWLDGYDPAFAQLGLGKVAVGEGIRSSIAAGRAYYDFMVGGEEYKYWYGASDRYCTWVMFTSGGLRSRLAHAAGGAAGLARRAQRR